MFPYHRPAKRGGLACFVVRTRRLHRRPDRPARYVDVPPAGRRDRRVGHSGRFLRAAASPDLRRAARRGQDREDRPLVCARRSRDEARLIPRPRAPPPSHHKGGDDPVPPGKFRVSQRAGTSSLVTAPRPAILVEQLAFSRIGLVDSATEDCDGRAPPHSAPHAPRHRLPSAARDHLDLPRARSFPRPLPLESPLVALASPTTRRFASATSFPHVKTAGASRCAIAAADTLVPRSSDAPRLMRLFQRPPASRASRLSWRYRRSRSQPDLLRVRTQSGGSGRKRRLRTERLRDARQRARRRRSAKRRHQDLGVHGGPVTNSGKAPQSSGPPEPEPCWGASRDVAGLSSRTLSPPSPR